MLLAFRFQNQQERTGLLYKPHFQQNLLHRTKLELHKHLLFQSALYHINSHWHLLQLHNKAYEIAIAFNV